MAERLARLSILFSPPFQRRGFRVAYLPCPLAALLCAPPVHALTLDLPEEAAAPLPRARLAKAPPDFEEMASRYDAALQTSKFDSAAVLAPETDRRRCDYTAMGDIDGFVIRISDSLGDAVAAASNIRL